MRKIANGDKLNGSAETFASGSRTGQALYKVSSRFKSVADKAGAGRYFGSRHLGMVSALPSVVSYGKDIHEYRRATGVEKARARNTLDVNGGKTAQSVGSSALWTYGGGVGASIAGGKQVDG